MRHEKTTNLTRLAARAALLLTIAACACAAQAQQASTAYRGTAKDPFEKRKFAPKPVKPGPRPVEAPPVEARIQAYKERRAAAVAAEQPAPKPTTAFLLNELEVKGIFRTPRGWAAMVEAKPIKLSYTIYPGESFYNGMLVAIEEERLVFRHETRWTDGRREMSVELKPLAAPNAVRDAMTTTAANAVTASAAPAPSSPADAHAQTSSSHHADEQSSSLRKQ
ncbi:MAG: hypothetical protein LC746_03530 [Acidobacteria bacterium]|nr:hypothetical protein [Acidobacteriota bacterium]